LGVNLAGVSIILNMRERMNQMQRDFEGFLHYIRENISQELFSVDERSKNALVPRRKITVVEIKRGGRIERVD
jgi:MerR family transcriptional regulator/heat shock protein HspR